MQKYQDNMRMVDRIPEALSGAMGNQMYVATFSTVTRWKSFIPMCWPSRRTTPRCRPS